MNLSKAFVFCALPLFVMSCSKFERALDVPDQIEETNKGMHQTNESIRKQTIAVTLSNMMDEKNRQSLVPVPFDMLPFAQPMAEALTGLEALKFVQLTMKKINEESFENKYPDVDVASVEGKALLKDLEHNKLADLMMITAVCGYLPDQLLNDMIAAQSEQGAYRGVLYQVLMLRTIFYNDLMLNASVMENKLETLGMIDLAIDYNSKIDFIARLRFANRVELKISGFKDPDMNAGISKTWDSKLALTNWKRISSAAQQDFKATSFSNDNAENTRSVETQNKLFAASLAKIQGYVNSWTATP